MFKNKLSDRLFRLFICCAVALTLVAAELFCDAPIGALNTDSVGVLADSDDSYNGLKITSPDGSQTFYSSDGNNEIITVNMTDPSNCVFTGKHRDSTAGMGVGQSHIVYETTGFTFTKKKPAKSGNVTAIRHCTIGVGEFLLSNVSCPDGYIRTTYTISWDKVYEILDSLGYSEEELAKPDGVTLYMSNIFKTVYRTKTASGITENDRKTQLDTLDKMLAAEDWSPTTAGILPYYYSIPVTIRRVCYPMCYIHTSCAECALLNVSRCAGGSLKKNNIVYCDRHASDHKDVWFEYEQKEYGKLDGKTVLQTSETRVHGGKTWTVNASYDDSGTVTRCKSYFVYYDPEMTANGGVIGSPYAWQPKTSENAVYRLYAEGGLLNTVIRQSQSYNGAVIIEYNDGTLPGGGPDTPDDFSAGSDADIAYFDTSESAELWSPYFDASSQIPTTEDLSVTVRASEYLIEVSYRTVTGTKYYAVNVEQPYEITYMGPETFVLGEDGLPLIGEDGLYVMQPGEQLSMSGTVSGTVNISRDYSYTELVSYAYYGISGAEVKNTALPGGSVSLTPSGYSIPTLSRTVYSSGEAGHVFDPDNIGTTIVLPTYYEASDSTLIPEVPELDASAESVADGEIGQVKVRNDRLAFGSGIVLDDRMAEKNAPSVNTGAVKKPGIIGAGVLSCSGRTIPATLSNAIYPASGTLTYSLKSSYNSSRPATLSVELSPNSVGVHTPVVCNPVVSCDNMKYVQLSEPDTSCYPLVVGSSDSYGSSGHEYDSSDIVLGVSNYGTHLSVSGYGTRDYLGNLAGSASYMATDSRGLTMNQVSFPFNIYVDCGNNRVLSDDSLLRAGEWFTLGSSTQRFYLPDDTIEGTYTVRFRSVAVNGASKRGLEMSGANLNRGTYVATGQIRVQVSGKLYGLSLNDVSLDAEWKDVFRTPSVYSPIKKVSAGAPDGTLEGSGYSKKSAYYYTSGTLNELGLTTGRDARFVLPVISGCNPSYINRGVLKCGYTDYFTLKTTGSDMYGGSVTVTPVFYYISEDGSKRERVRLYSESIDSTGKKKYLTEICEVTECECVSADVARQEWSFMYRLPAGVLIASADEEVLTGRGYSYKSDIWKKDGYLVVNFEIAALGRTGREHLSYANTFNSGMLGCCNMWKLEGQSLSRTNFYGTAFSFEYGDTLLFSVDYSAGDDAIVKRLY